VGKTQDRLAIAQFFFDNLGPIIFIVVVLGLLLGVMNLDTIKPLMDQFITWIKALKG